MSSSSTPTHPAEARFNERRNEYDAYLFLIERVELELQKDVDNLQAQEGWDTATSRGAVEWAHDRASVFRALRRNHFNEEKTHTFLLSALSRRLDLGLAGSIPSPPDDRLFSILPLPRCVDRLGRPVVVLSLQRVTRDESGSLHELKEWVWWGLELVRRALREWWVDARRGSGAEGCVLLVDAEGAGYRNMEVELLPTLFSVGHNNFPGVFESVYVVNAGWSHRVMWNSIVRRVLPRSALDKLAFLESSQDTESVFDLDRLPTVYGGRNSTQLEDPGVILKRYSNLELGHIAAASLTSNNLTAVAGVSSRDTSRAPSRSTSCASIADVYYTAPGTPVSGAPSRRGSAIGLGLMGIGPHLTMTSKVGGGSHLALPRLDVDGTLLRQDVDASSHDLPPHHHPGKIEPPRPSQELGPLSIQRIKSLSNFHLYLSPSRLANRDYLSDSDDEADGDGEGEPSSDRERDRDRSRRRKVGMKAFNAGPAAPESTQLPVTVLTPPPRRLLRPAILECEPGSIAARRAASAATAASHSTRPRAASTYSSQLLLHHAKGVEQYRPAMVALEPSATPTPVSSTSHSADTDRDGDGASTPLAPSPTVKVSDVAASTAATPEDEIKYSSDANPWFGYPVVRVPGQSGSGYAIRPRYARNRKRDLVKTLLFLFMLRLQSWRDGFERALGLNRLGITGWRGSSSSSSASAGPGSSSGALEEEPHTPTQGLLRAAAENRQQRSISSSSSSTKKAMVRAAERDWIWMAIGFLLLRGTWTRVIAAPLEALGLDAVRDFLGLV